MDGSLQFYHMTAEKYLGISEVPLIYDKEGKLMKNGLGLKSSSQSKAVVMKKPGQNRQYYLITHNSDKSYGKGAFVETVVNAGVNKPFD